MAGGHPIPGLGRGGAESLLLSGRQPVEHLGVDHDHVRPQERRLVGGEDLTGDRLGRPVELLPIAAHHPLGHRLLQFLAVARVRCAPERLHEQIARAAGPYLESLARVIVRAQQRCSEAPGVGQEVVGQAQPDQAERWQTIQHLGRDGVGQDLVGQLIGRDQVRRLQGLERGHPERVERAGRDHRELGAAVLHHGDRFCRGVRPGTVRRGAGGDGDRPVRQGVGQVGEGGQLVAAGAAGDGVAGAGDGHGWVGRTVRGDLACSSAAGGEQRGHPDDQGPGSGCHEVPPRSRSPSR